MFAEHVVHVDVVRFRKRVGHDLIGETDTDFFRVRACGGQHPIVEPATAAEAPAASIEGKARAEEGVDLVGRDFGEGGGWLADAKGAGDQLERGIFHGVKLEVMPIDARINPAVVGMTGDQFR